MFGFFRLFLAAVVVTFHAGFWPWGLYTGVSAVVVFYILSGYVITGLISTRFPDTKSFGAFMAERTIRIAPQYYLWIAVSFAFVFLLHWTPIAPGKPSSWTVFSYWTLIPLGLMRYTRDTDFPFIGQATSLAIEFIAYAIAAFVVRSRVASIALTVLYLVIFLASATGALPPTIYTYYTAPAPMVFFMLGSFIYRRDWRTLVPVSVTLLAILSLGWSFRMYPEMIIGMAFGIPAMLLLKDRQGGRLDAELGNAAYGCFLCQGMVMDVLVHFGMTRSTPAFVAAATVLSCAAGYASYRLVEKPTLRLRRSFRSRAKAAQAAASGAPLTVAAQ